MTRFSAFENLISGGAGRLVDAIIFDAEGVVIDTEPVWDRSQEAFLHRHGAVYNRETTKHLLTGRSLLESTRVLKEMYQLSGDDGELTAERAALFTQHLDEIRFVDGFLAFYAKVRANFRTCIATSASEAVLSRADEALHLHDLFSGRIYSIADVGGVSKPDPALFLYAATQVGTAPRRCAVIEDSPLGIEAAQRAGMFAVGLATTYDPDRLAHASLVVRTFAEL